MLLRMKPRKTQMDVALANVDTYIPYSNQVITIRDLAAKTQENLLPKRPDPIVVKADSARRLRFENTFSDIEVTNVFGFEIDTFVSRPLWYKYTLAYSYHNKTKTTQRVSKRVNLDTGNRSIERVTSEQTKIILRGSTSLKYTDILNNPSVTYGSETEGSRFVVDYARKDITYIAPAFGGLDPKGTLSATYAAIDSDIEINLDDPAAFLIDAVEFDTNTYIITIYAAERNPLTIKYNTFENDELIQIEETTAFEPIYIEVADLGLTTHSNSFACDGLVVTLKVANQYDDFAVRQKILSNTRVFVNAPYGLTLQEQWFLKLSRNEFTKDGLTYGVVETNASVSRPYRKYEQPLILDDHSIKLTQRPIYQRSKSGITGIELFTAEGDAINISEIDDATNIVTTVERISAREVVTAVYEYDDDLIVINPVDLNPKNMIRPDFDLMKRVMVVFILPQEELLDLSQPVFVGYLPRYTLGTEIRYTDGDILETMTASDVYPIVSQYVNTTEVHPIALAVITIDNVYLPKISKIRDVRVRGGGIHSGMQVDNKEIADDVFQMLDIGTWDGEVIDLGGVLIFRIPDSIQNSIRNRFINNDEEIIFASSADEKDRLLTKKVNDFFRNMVEKRKPVGRRALIEYL